MPATEPTWVEKLRTDLSHFHSPDPKSTQFPMALATVADGKPKVRMVGHADLLFMSHARRYAILIGTDSRSPKAEQVRANHNVELVYWFEKEREQFRITGDSFLVDSNSSDAVWLNERGRYLSTLKPGRKMDYARANAPGTPVGTPMGNKSKQLPGPEDFDDSGPKKDTHQQALDHYALLVVIPDTIDWSSERQQGKRKLWKFDEEADEDLADEQRDIQWPEQDLHY